MRTFISNTENMDLSEIYQDVDIHFSFAKEKDVNNRKRIVQQHPWVKCRDFLNDAHIYSYAGTYSPTIYGFEYDGRNNPINFDNIEMLMRIGRSPSQATELRHAIRVLNKFEKEFGIAPSVMKPIMRDDPTNTYKFFHIKGSNLWLTNTITLSLYTHFIRAIYAEPQVQSIKQLVENYDELSGKAWEYTRTINRFGYHNLEKLFANLKDLCLHVSPSGIDPDEVPESQITMYHDQVGFVTWMANGGDQINMEMDHDYDCEYCEEQDCDNCPSNQPDLVLHGQFSELFNKL